MIHEETIKRIQKLVPSVMALEFGCEIFREGAGREIFISRFGNEYSVCRLNNNGLFLPITLPFPPESQRFEIIGKPITLAVILLALDINSTDSRWKIIVGCNFMRIQFGESFSLWNLSKDNFNDQSEETKTFIGGLLGN